MITIDDVKLLSFPEFGDDRGRLAVVEGGADKNIPFDIKRIFYIYGTKPETVRGGHVNIYSEFFFINICGKSKIKVADQGLNERIFVLDKPNVGLYLPRMIWKEMYGFSPDSILLVISSEYYDKNEYINDLHTFKNYREGLLK